MVYAKLVEPSVLPLSSGMSSTKSVRCQHCQSSFGLQAVLEIAAVLEHKTSSTMENKSHLTSWLEGWQKRHQVTESTLENLKTPGMLPYLNFQVLAKERSATESVQVPSARCL